MSNSAYVRSVIERQFKPVRSRLSQNEVVAFMAAKIQQLPVRGMKIISIVGGAASGKSTIAEELVAYLQTTGIKTDMLCTDNYVVGDREYRQVELKDADAQQKYDFDLMDSHIEAINNLTKNSQEVAVPVIDAKTGVAVDTKKPQYPYVVNKVDILVIEGDFPRDNYDIRFFLQVPDMQRLHNNIERETEHNDDADPAELTEHFNNRQRTLHKPYTLPALQQADYVLEADTAHDDWLYTMYQRTE